MFFNGVRCGKKHKICLQFKLNLKIKKLKKNLRRISTKNALNLITVTTQRNSFALMDHANVQTTCFIEEKNAVRK